MENVSCKDGGARRAPLVLVALVALLSGRPAAGEAPTDDGVPPGTVAFFVGRDVCPDGWMAAGYTRGRMVVAVTSALDVGAEVGTPLGDGEDRRHRHDYAAMVALPDKAIAATDGPNDQGAQAQTYAVAGMSDEETSGLPFVQLLGCEKP